VNFADTPPQLPYTTSWQDLKDIFRTAGPIVRADVMMLPNGKSKGQGTVLFETKAAAQAAIGKRLPLCFCWCLLFSSLALSSSSSFVNFRYYFIASCEANYNLVRDV
jgi:hypothetical protein